jgi:3-deoxy-D-arabino-heptulosonate 7-phosphate (DAHP) synthase
VLVEVHNDPEKALCDAAQALTLGEYEQMLAELRAIRGVIAH